MKIPKVEKFSPVHAILRPFFDFYVEKIFFQNIYKLGKEKIPKDEALIVTMSHQAALMDPLAVLVLKNWQPVFLARSDIFKPKLNRAVLFFLKIIPVFRVRDGLRNVKQNEETFAKVVEILKKKKVIVIAPEASHVPQRRIRNLSKGFARFAFEAAEKTGFSLPIKILPVGVHYEDYYSARVSLVVQVGDPVDFSDLYDLYKQNPNKAYLELRDRVADALKKNVIHIENAEKYKACEILKEIGREVMIEKNRDFLFLNEKQRFLKDKKFIEILRSKIKPGNPQAYGQLLSLSEEYAKELEKHKFGDFTVRKDTGIFKLIFKVLMAIVLFPVFLAGFVINAPVYYLPKLQTRKVDDESFHTSFRLVYYLILFPLYYLGLFFLAKFIIPSLWWRLSLFVILPLLGMFSLSYARFVKKTFEKIRFRFGKFREKLRRMRQEIKDLIKNLLDSSNTKEKN